MIAGLLRPDAGSVLICGHEPTSVGARAHLGLAEQATALYLSLPVRANLEIFAGFHSMSRGRAGRRAAEIIDLLALGEQAETPVRELSGGLRRLVHVGAALVHEPAVVVLDEPSVGLDVETKARFHDAIRRVAASGAAVLLSSHDMGEVERTCDRVVILSAGALVASGPVARLLVEYGRPWVTLDLRADVVPAATAVLAGLGVDAAVDPTGRLVFGTNDPTVALRCLLDAPALADGFQSLSVVPPGLESVYLSLCGQRFEPGVDEPVDA